MTPPPNPARMTRWSTTLRLMLTFMLVTTMVSMALAACGLVSYQCAVTVAAATTALDTADRIFQS